MPESEPSSAAKSEPMPSSGPQLDAVARLLLIAGWLGSLIFAWLPILLAISGAGLLLLWTGISYAFLRVGAFTVPDSRFMAWTVAGLALAGLSIVGAVLRRILRPREQRERLIGPGGRVLRILLRQPTPPLRGALDYLPDAWSMIGLLALVTLGVSLLWRHPGGGPVSGTIVSANLALLSVYLLFWVLWLGWRVARGLYRFAMATEYRAGVVTTLLLVVCVSTAGSWVRLNRDSGEDIAVPEAATDLATKEVASTPDAAVRTMLFGLTEVTWPEAATREGVRHLIAPLLAQTAHPPPEELVRADTDGLPRLAQYGGFVSADEAASPAFKFCIDKLYPDQVSRVKRLPSFRSFRLDDDTEHDVLLGAVLKICENHAFRNPYDDLPLVLERAAVNGAIDSKRHRRREVTSYDPDAHMGQVCPIPSERPDRRLIAEQELARVNWLGITSLQKAIVIEKAVLGYEDDEIAANHPPMTPKQVKDTYQNTLKKIRNKLTDICPLPPRSQIRSVFSDG